MRHQVIASLVLLNGLMVLINGAGTLNQIVVLMNLIIQAMKIISAERPSECPVVIAKNIGREGEVVDLTVIKEFDPNMFDMLTVILIGNKESRPRGPI